MSRKDWCEYDRETRKYIKKRDENKCYLCGSTGSLQIMHIWINRSHGGKGCKENGVLGCIDCHRIMDNPIGAEQNELSKIYLQRCKDYLIEVEHIIPNDEFIESLKFKKQIIKINDNVEYIKTFKKKDRCKDCKFLIKSKCGNSTIPSYYCKYRHILINKSTEACKSFKSN